LQINFYNVVSAIAVFQSGFLSLFFINNKRGARRSNIILSFILLVHALYIIYTYTLSFGAGEGAVKYYNILFLVSQTAFLLGPLLFLYILSILKPDFKLSPVHLLHSLPFFMAIIYILAKTQNLTILVDWGSQLRTAMSAGVIIHLFIYLMASFYLKRFKLQSIISVEDDSKMSWLRFLLLGYIFLWFIQLHIFVFIDIWKLYQLCPYSDSLYFTCVFIFCNCIAWIAMNKPEIFSFHKRYQTSELSEQDKQKYLDKLLAHIEADKIYLEPSITLTALAKKLHIPNRYLSQIINETFNLNFCDFINRYRVEYSKPYLSKLEDGKKNILEIAYMVGFNSKSSFNQAFKKHTGVTPSEFRSTGS